jgi:hypothetical protein
MHSSFATIPDPFQKFHLSGIFLARIVEIQTQDAAGFYAGAAEASSPWRRCVSNSCPCSLRERRSSVLSSGIASCRLRAMLLRFASWLAWTPNSISPTKLRQRIRVESFTFAPHFWALELKRKSPANNVH